MRFIKEHWKILLPVTLIWLGILIGIWTTCKDWDMLAAIGAWVLVLGVFAAILQINQAKRSTNAQIAMGLYRELRDEKAIQKLRNIYTIDGGKIKYLSNQQKQDVDYILDRLDTLGNLVIKGIVDDKLAIEAYGGPPALRFWYVLKDYFRMIQKQRGYYGENFEAFTRRSLEYFKENDIEIKYYQTSIEDKGIPLVETLMKLIDEQKSEALWENKKYPRGLEEIKEDRMKEQARRQTESSQEGSSQDKPN
ncbi:MAG: hypothetical protein ABIK32_03185 [Chloroflexota bacterium]|nr:hypothetical protein [Chloroflexota bacterium]